MKLVAEVVPLTLNPYVNSLAPLLFGHWEYLSSGI
jgi:hypothetical protein